MSNRWLEINCSLRSCRKVFAILKQKNPDLLPDYIDILAYRKNSKKCHFNDDCRALGMKDHTEWVAHFDHPFLMSPHVCLKQDFLFLPFDIPTWQGEGPDKVPAKRMRFIHGNFCLIEIICHELSHYIHIGHKKDFFKIYYKFLSQMAQVVISGEFYYWYSIQHQSKKHSGKADKQTAETKEWVDDYLSWTQYIPSLFGK